MIKLVSDTVDRNDINSLIEWLSQDEIPRLTKGELTVELENKWANKIGTKYSVFVNSGSSSILLTLAALKHSNRLKNNKVVVPSLSWATDLSSPILLGLESILCDCNLSDLSCDLDHLEEIFQNESPSALILVSVLGLVPDMDRVIELCNKYDVLLLEDVCESMGSKYKEKYLGTFGLASFFSMYFGHHLSTIEGGFINTDDEEFYYTLLMMRSHGWARDLPTHIQNEYKEKYNLTDFENLYNFYLPGMNLRSTDLQAYIGLRAIDKLDNFSKTRNKNFNHYVSHLENNELNLVIDPDNFISNFAMPILSKNRNSIVKKLIENNIECRPLIAGNLANKPFWYENFSKPNLKNCELLDKYGFYIPNHQDLTTNDLNKIIQIINNEL
jgi:CDP-4-dehydro-6-deoxyglucose reductase, E1